MDSTQPPKQPVPDPWTPRAIFAALARQHLREANWSPEQMGPVRRLVAALGPRLQQSFVERTHGLASGDGANADLPIELVHYFSQVLRANQDDEDVGQITAVEYRKAVRNFDVDAFALRLLETLTGEAFSALGNNIAACRETVGALQRVLLTHAKLLQSWAARSDTTHVPAQTDIDPGTGLPNHRALLRELSGQLQSWNSNSGVLALLVIDLKFSQLAADGEAYSQTETLYAESARRLRSVLREADFAGRLSRHEFAAILPRITGSGLAILAASRVLRALEEPFEVNGHSALGRLAVGIAVYPEHGQDAEKLLHHAEIARDEAQQSQEPYALYDREFHRQDRMKRSLEALLRHALHENELEIYLQPQVDLASGQIVGAEALLRWRLDDDTYVPPQQIVAVAEDGGLMSALTMWVFNTALRHAAELRRRGIDISVSVNVTPSNLNEVELPDFVRQALGTWGVPADRLVIELTETAMIGDNRRPLENLHRLKQLGVQLSIDDFGTGYSSMAYLKRMPLDELKVDQTFVRNMLDAKEDERIVRSVIDLAHHFDLQVVAEGVEDVRTMEALRLLGCDLAQGYLIDRPMPAKEFAAWWEQHAAASHSDGA
jgi:diguanylate cyclase (GGDEF)-like protein